MKTRQTLARFVLCVAMVAAALACFPRLAAHPTDLLTGPQRAGNNDLTAFFLASRSFPNIVLRQYGQLPLWDPYQHFGIPFFGNAQSSILYPPNLVFFLSEPSKIASWMFVAHHVWGGAGVFFLCRRLQTSKVGAFAGYVSFLGAPYSIAHTMEGHYNQLCVISWIPWAFLAYDMFLFDSKRGRCLVAVTLSLGFFAGHAQELFYLVTVLSVFVALDAFKRFRFGRADSGKQLIFGWVFIGFLTLGLVAVELSQIAIVAKSSIRANGLSILAAGQGIYWRNLLQLFYPWAMGGPSDYQHPTLPFWESICYFGVLPFGLAMLGVVRKYRVGWVSRFGWLWLFGIIFAFGSSSPVFRVFFFYWPGGSLFRAPSRMLFFCSFSVSVLVAFGVDAVVGFARQKLRLGWAVAICLIIVMTIELSMFSYAVSRGIPRGQLRNENAAVQALLPAYGGGRIAADQQLLTDAEAVKYSIPKLQGYQPVPLFTTLAAVRNATNADPVETALGFRKLTLDALVRPGIDLLSVRYVIVRPHAGQMPTGFRLISRGMVRDTVTLRGADTRHIPFEIYENTKALPVAYITRNLSVPTKVNNSRGEVRSVDSFDTLLLPKNGQNGNSSPKLEQVRVLRYSPNSIVLLVSVDAPGYVVLTDTWFPGWVASVDGEPSEVHRANDAFRAVKLRPGTHRVEFTYRPRLLVITGVLSALTLFLVASNLIRYNVFTVNFLSRWPPRTDSW